MLPRDFPRPYIETALSLLHGRGLHKIVEIGSMRHELIHGLDEIILHCCLDGHSSILFARAPDDELVTVDIDFATSINAGKAIKEIFGKHIEVVCRDGIEFLKSYDRPIDLLFLDAWDANLPGSAENHLEAFKAAERNLHEDSLVLIDDTDVEPDGDGYVVMSDDGLGGKGKLLIKYMLENGWTLLFSGRQTLLVRKCDPEEWTAVETGLGERRVEMRKIVVEKFPSYPIPEI